ncbi:MBL fold metallo-hydrolase [Candidatus Poribacteria bacterium]|nr:MBL fold metallo-hydrolase [Candidatus Poribacteria bacterium]
MQTRFSQLSHHLYVHHGHVNTGILRDGDRALLIEPSGTALQATLAELGIIDIEQILFTHYHRDSTAGFPIPDNVRVGVPAKGASWFSEVETFWDDPQYRWHLYNYHPHNLMLANSISVVDEYMEGMQFGWGPASLTVLETPGHTDGSVTYLIDVDGERFAFSGDLIYDEGQLWELYSLQKGQQTSDYHGFLGARDELTESLEKIRQTSPTALVPTHGVVMKNPDGAIDSLLQQLAHCYDKYVAISALRHYFPILFAEFEGHAGHMPIREGKPPPEFLRHFGTTWMIISENNEAFVMDCGSPNVIKQIQQLQADGEISEVTQFWVTHYHDDHVDAIPEFQTTFPCETITDSVVARVITNPIGFRLPCISPSVTRVDRITRDGDSWQWNEFTMTAYHFPGQTYYHGGLLVEGRGIRMFFSGDSFTMAGIDDYCSGNRNLLGKDVGYEKCLRLIQELKPTHIFNCHVNPAFEFTDAEMQCMLDTLAEREKCYTELFPWDHANYGIDEHWVRCYPYEQEVVLGETAQLRVEITNHSSEPRTAIVQPILPSAWDIGISPAETTISARSDGHIDFSVPIPRHRDTSGKRIVVPVDITYDERPLGQFREAIFVLTGSDTPSR